MKGVVVSFQPGVEPLVEREVRALDPHAKLRETLEPGLWRVDIATDDPHGARFRAAISRHPPVAIRHLHPIEVDLVVDDLVPLVDVVSPLAARLEPGLGVSVQTRVIAEPGKASPFRAFDVNDAIQQAIGPVLEERGLVYDRKRPAQIISCTLRGKRLLAGLSRTVDNLSAWPGGMARIAGGDDALSRAKKKLLEALDVFSIALPKSGRALDLGAAPGGWTQALLEHGLSVTAVDPASLDHRLSSPKLEHYRGTAERFLASQPRGGFGLIVNDMRLDARDTARLLVAFAELLAPSGSIISTLKLPERGFVQVLDAAFDILRDHYRIRARQLFHNRSEVTAVLVPR
jgi:23S rRNA (cytidine2498-2'-O)-methyltransferase